MTENSFPGPMTMVKIDGTKIKKLREQQGLTQLYVATAVDVTTDTISRWENRRYPSIKKENGLKLAETLNVSLDDLLEVDNESENEESRTSTEIELGEKVEPSKIKGLGKVWPLLVLSGCLFGIFLIFGYYFLAAQDNSELNAIRTAPSHSISGQPIPVVLQISETSGQPTAMILRELLPKDSEIVHTSPPATGKNPANREIKWLGKINSTATYFYIIRLHGVAGQTIQYSGSTSISDNEKTSIGGVTQTYLGKYHWADEDEDNIISDQEILLVYDKYSDVSGLDKEIDLVEEIWLGSGYKWESDSENFDILD
ncbi:MAG: helix-turn-helix transcriptional regulator [Desulfobulbaceae bacterium]|nr:helix-turn-helix transcriptional regulator [Desulfobulbaceae bacterium]